MKNLGYFWFKFLVPLNLRDRACQEVFMKKVLETPAAAYAQEVNLFKQKHLKMTAYLFTFKGLINRLD